MRVTKQYRTETGHRLTNYDGKCSHLHGHSYLWEVTAEAHGLENGMVLDFKDLKSAMKTVLEPLDHCLVLHEEDPLVENFGAGDDLKQLLQATNGKEPRLWLTPFNPTAENFAMWAAAEITKLLPVHISIARIQVWETATSFATWGD